MVELFANSAGPDQTLHSVASDLGQHFLPSILLWGLQTKSVKTTITKQVVKETHIIHYYPNLSFDVRDKTLLERQYYYIEVFTREKQSGLFNGMLILSGSVDR